VQPIFRLKELNKKGKIISENFGCSFGLQLQASRLFLPLRDYAVTATQTHTPLTASCRLFLTTVAASVAAAADLPLRRYVSGSGWLNPRRRPDGTERTSEQTNERTSSRPLSSTNHHPLSLSASNELTPSRPSFRPFHPCPGLRAEVSLALIQVQCTRLRRARARKPHTSGTDSSAIHRAVFSLVHSLNLHQSASRSTDKVLSEMIYADRKIITLTFICYLFALPVPLCFSPLKLRLCDAIEMLLLHHSLITCSGDDQ